MNTPTLESIQADFHHWREHRPHRRSPTPPELRDKALSLRDQHSTNAICRALGITRRMLLNWQNPPSALQHQTSAPVEFVRVPAEAEEPHSESHPLQLSLSQASGNHWCLKGDPSAEQLRAFVSALAGAAP